MAIHLSLRVAPPDLQQGGNSRISYVHVPAARMSIVIYIATAINSSLFPLTKHPLFLRSSGTGTEIGAFSTLFTLVTGGFRGRPMWGTFRVWDARLTSVFILFLIYLGALRFQKLPVEPAPISIRAGPIDIPIIKSPVNWWNTSHQPGSISRSGTSIHVPMPIPILSNFANFPFSTPFKFHFKGGRRTMILSVLSSPALVSGLMVVRAKNPVHSVLFPILVFCDTAGLLILLGLDFSAMIFPVVHIGAIAVSFLFVVMMFNIQIAEIHEEVLRYLPVSGIIGLIFWWEMFFILDNETIPLLPTHRNTTSLRYTVYAGKVRSWTNLETLGNLLYTYYSVWFLVSSLILLVAMIGAIVLTMHRTTKVQRQDVFRRNALDSRRTIMRRTTDQITIY
uniref:NADH-ubiquinone oxidoreductase chain 6 n=3 Tax=BOP clade TaxID=359160 RepID=A0A0E0MN14_ORYPU